MSEPSKSLVDDLKAILEESKRFCVQMPDRLLFGLLALIWVGLFHFLGNATIGYVKTTSLFGWSYHVMSTSPGDEMGLYMPLLFLGFAYWKRRVLLEVPKQKWWPAFILVLLGLALHWVGFVVQQSRVSIVGFFVGLYGIMGMVWGWRWLGAIFFPYCLFVFCVPLATETERITFPLRMYATKITALVCQTGLGINVIHDGTMLYDPAGRYQYEIAAACSGIQSLSATVAIAMIGSFVFFRSTWRRVVTLLAAFPLAVMGNVLRLTAIVVASEAFGEKAGKYVHDSSWLSMLPYVPALGGVMLLVKLLSENRPASPPAEPVAVNSEASGQPTS